MFSRKSAQTLIQEQMIKIKFVINTLNKNSVRSKSKEKLFAKKSKKAISIGDESTARVYAQQSIQHRHMALKLLKLACRMEMFESNIQLQVQSNSITTDISKVVGSLTNFCSPNMTLNNINMFESAFDDMTIASNVVSDTMDTSLAPGVGATLEEDELIDWAKDTNAHEHGNLPFMSLPSIDSLMGKGNKIPPSTNGELF
jgi:division protein CdvB (Snf7/Vps24/ESCRT-III family)